MPPEWHPHSGTLLCWPVNRKTWPGMRINNVERVYIELIQALYKHETVHLLVHDESIRRRVTEKLKKANLPENAVTYHLHPSDDMWARDFGPVYVKNELGGVAVTDWIYNAWGGKYPPFNNDNKIPGYLASAFNQMTFTPELILEGGSIDTNGKGVMLTTESVLLNPNRNPDYTKAQIEEHLKEYLGQQQVIWLKDGLAGDDTDGHIDDLSRFVSENVIITALADDPNDVNYKTLQHNYKILKAAENPSGGKFEIIPIPMPRNKINGTTVDGSKYVPASYANFYIANGLVLLPLYDERYDDQVRELFCQLFPDRDVTGIDCTDLVWGQGGIHCVTQQMYY